jgi:hypothetical protein
MFNAPISNVQHFEPGYAPLSDVPVTYVPNLMDIYQRCMWNQAFLNEAQNRGLNVWNEGTSWTITQTHEGPQIVVSSPDGTRSMRVSLQQIAPEIGQMSQQLFAASHQLFQQYGQQAPSLAGRVTNPTVAFQAQAPTAYSGPGVPQAGQGQLNPAMAQMPYGMSMQPSAVPIDLPSLNRDPNQAPLTDAWANIQFLEKTLDQYSALAEQNPAVLHLLAEKIKACQNWIIQQAMPNATTGIAQMHVMAIQSRLNTGICQQILEKDQKSKGGAAQEQLATANRQVREATASLTEVRTQLHNVRASGNVSRDKKLKALEKNLMAQEKVLMAEQKQALAAVKTQQLQQGLLDSLQRVLNTPPNNVPTPALYADISQKAKEVQEQRAQGAKESQSKQKGPKTKAAFDKFVASQLRELNTQAKLLKMRPQAEQVNHKEMALMREMHDILTKMKSARGWIFGSMKSLRLQHERLKVEITLLENAYQSAPESAGAILPRIRQLKKMEAEVSRMTSSSQDNTPEAQLEVLYALKSELDRKDQAFRRHPLQVGSYNWNAHAILLDRQTEVNRRIEALRGQQDI